MTRTLTFGADPADTRRFDTLFGAFILGGNRLLQQAQGARSRDERAKDAQILRALKAIARETAVDPDRRRFQLQPDGGTVALDQKQHELLARYVEAAPFPTEQSDELDEVLDWIAAAPTTSD